ncbi:Lipopolysaccharide export system protein LptC [Aquicella siphonis]|uniref:Lipopolysaccharide export system protein LptC n=1 Tax=Aquicella siphonis TaxID=254247 RepID=A0A5E4PIB5_9COXI|nr:LPS export ABC transporter periplasmic protein LptC [Aquicella siphonis]VVC76122.1 Lipopolysaccharide export system protein LptC [Aquicella siphonis]
MTYKYTAISAIMIAAVGLASWKTYFSFQPQITAPARKAELPDAFMENVTALVMDKQGKPSMKIVTPKMIHYLTNDTTLLTSPELTLYRKSPQPWYITSKNAKATQGVDNVHFWNNVVIHHAADANNPATLIKTTTLTVHPNAQVAETSDMITMVQPNLIVKATGMHADMNTGNIKLLSQARGEYVPSS